MIRNAMFWFKLWELVRGSIIVFCDIFDFIKIGMLLYSLFVMLIFLYAYVCVYVYVVFSFYTVK